MASTMALSSLVTLASLFTILSTPTSAQQILIPPTAFANASSFNQYFSYNYPWGTTHNGAARMSSNYCSFPGNNTLTETSVYSPNQADAGSASKPLKINYLACTVYAKQHFTVDEGSGLDFSAEFIAPTTKGTWPAFWLTAVQGWPPEIDIAEWKGNGDISFNTFNTSSEVTAVNVPYAPDTQWHSVKASVRDEQDGSGDASVQFWLDGELRSTQFAKGYVGKALYLVIDFQMEGSSGSPGPTTSKFIFFWREILRRSLVGG